MPDYQHIKQPFLPVYDEKSEILILGSLPSVKSRENGFYYGHPQNRFWKTLAGVLKVTVPTTVEEKKEMLIKAHIAVWDVIESCDIQGSSDSTIRNVEPADMAGLLKKTNIKKIYANGKTAEKLYHKWIYPLTGVEVVPLPSTSPANAAFSLEKLIHIWGEALSGGVQSEEKQSITHEMMVTREEYCKMLLDAHFRSENMEECLKAWDEMYQKTGGMSAGGAEVQVKIWYKKEDSLTVILSLGDFYDDWIDAFEKRGELLKAYAVENYALALMRKAYEVFGKEIYAREGKYPGELQFFDEEQMQTVPDLLAELDITEVQCNEAFVMIPQKTVVFSTELSREKQADCDDVCANCGRTNCPNRQEAGKIDEKTENYRDKSVLNYGYRQILSNKENDLWKKD